MNDLILFANVYKDGERCGYVWHGEAYDKVNFDKWNPLA